MLLELIHRKRRRAISPVIATLLIIALALAAAAVVVTVLNATNNDNLAFDDDGIGTSSQSKGINQPSIDIAGIQPNDDLKLHGIDEYTQIKVDVTNVADKPVYVFDIDVLVYGQKLDEIAQWTIDSADVKSGARVVRDDNNYYRQPAKSVATYTVSLSQPTIQNARIPLNASFVYEVIYGASDNTISGSVQKVKLSQVLYSPIIFDVAIFHYGSSFTSNDAARQFEDTLKSVNGTNKIEFIYDRATDTYDYRNNPGSIIVEEIISNYDIVIIDTWAVPLEISNQLLKLHVNETKLIFYGSVSTLGNDFSSDQTTTIQSRINVTATQEIIGVTPDMAGAPSNIDVTDHKYNFDSTTSSILAGLSGSTFEEDEDESYTGGGGNNPSVCGDAGVTGSGVGDIYGYDMAQFTGSSSNFINYGSAYFDFQRDNGGLTSISGYPKSNYSLFVEKFNDTSSQENETLVLSFIWKHNNSFAPNGADLVDGTQLSQIRTNMLGAATGESTRIFSFKPRSTIDVFNVNVPSSSGKWFDLQVEGKIKGDDVDAGSLSIEVDMPEYQFHDCSPDQTGNFYVDGVEVASGISVVIKANSIISVDIGDYYSGTISQGSSYKLSLGPVNTELFKIDADDTFYDWPVTIKTGDFSAVTETFNRAVDTGADQTAPDQVTGLEVTGQTSSSIDLSWDATSDNGGGTVSYYEINRDGTVIDTTTSTSYTDTGLSPDTSYTYKVRAVDDSGNTGLYSSEVTGTTTSGTPPPKVTGLNATTVSSSQIDLAWDSLASIDSYNIYRDSSLLTSVPVGTTTFSDTGLNSGTTYTYEVSAVNNSLEGEKSDPVSNTTDETATSQMHVSDISIIYNYVQGNKYTVDITITIQDSDNSSLSGVTVDISYTFHNTQGNAQGTTGADGTVTISPTDTAQDGKTVSITINSLTKADYTWDDTQGVTQLNDATGPPDESDATTS